nr:MAG TPA: hypothetical protein [Caudoviricetes sp.]
MLITSFIKISFECLIPFYLINQLKVLYIVYFLNSIKPPPIARIGTSIDNKLVWLNTLFV